MYGLKQHALALAFCIAAAPAVADVITFTGEPIGAVAAGVHVEGDFSWQVIAGGGFHGLGNPNPGLEALTTAGGGTISFFRNDVSGGLFTFDFSDIARFTGPDPAQILFEGYVSNVLQASDLFTTNAGSINWLNVASTNLASINIDELRIRLDVGEMVDNIQLNAAAAVPEPATLALLGLGLAGLAFSRRKQ